MHHKVLHDIAKNLALAGPTPHVTSPQRHPQRPFAVHHERCHKCGNDVLAAGCADLIKQIEHGVTRRGMRPHAIGGASRAMHYRRSECSHWFAPFCTVMDGRHHHILMLIVVLPNSNLQSCKQNSHFLVNLAI